MRAHALMAHRTGALSLNCGGGLLARMPSALMPWCTCGDRMCLHKTIFVCEGDRETRRRETCLRVWRAAKAAAETDGRSEHGRIVIAVPSIDYFLVVLD